MFINSAIYPNRRIYLENKRRSSADVCLLDMLYLMHASVTSNETGLSSFYSEYPSGRKQINLLPSIRRNNKKDCKLNDKKIDSEKYHLLTFIKEMP